MRNTATDFSPEGRATRLVKRRLVGASFRISHKNAYQTLDIPINGRKVVGVYIRQKTYADKAIISHMRYYGSGASGQQSQAFILSLNSEPIFSRYGEVTVNAGAGKKIYVAQPVEAGQPIIEYNGFEGGFYSPKIISLTNPDTGAQSDYYLYESVNENLGETTLEIS